MPLVVVDRATGRIRERTGRDLRSLAAAAGVAGRGELEGDHDVDHVVKTAQVASCPFPDAAKAVMNGVGVDP